MADIKSIIDSDNLRALLVAFFNLKRKSKKDFKNLVIESSYRKSTHDKDQCLFDDEIKKKNNELLCNWIGLPFELKIAKDAVHTLTIENIDNLSMDEIFKQIYKKIIQMRIDIDDEEFELDLLKAIFVMRGSFDISAKYITIDILKDIQTKLYLKLFFQLITNLSNYSVLNLNFRELQPQYKSDEKKRNSQFRINMRWFAKATNYDISDLNIYKDCIMKVNKSLIERFNIQKNVDEKFVSRALMYQNNLDDLNMIDKKQKAFIIEKMRKDLGFNDDKNESVITRSSNVKKLASSLFPDECVSCKNKYDIKDRSFIQRTTNSYYFELHHVISFSADKKGDQIDNLVKLCPVCHAAIHNGLKSEQEEIITNIIHNSETARGYVSNFFDNPVEKMMISFILDKLK